MKPIYTTLFAALCSLALPALADDQSTCQSAGGVLMSGVVKTDPVFQAGSYKRGGFEMSHTHLTMQSDADQKFYDVAMDNLFASGYDTAGEAIPDPLTQIKKGDHLQACGVIYTGPFQGIHYVHTNCGQPPTQGQADGWIKELAADGTAGPNLENSQAHCSIFK